jgi:Asp-tRNA(Asn)/Glu-tRNA(Gln) amidotransferase A subunit family amidase
MEGPMNFEDYRRQDATGLAQLVAKKQVSAAEVLEAALARTEAVNPKVNAVVIEQFAQAQAQVAKGAPAGKLGGVPYLIKDLGTYQKGVKATFGSRAFADFVADHDSAYTRRCLEAGLVIYGRSSSPEFGLVANTAPLLYGACRNPWNLEHSAGGSSGGAAAAVAAGMLPMAHATDGGGSIRIPAAQCGLFGLKPTRGRVSMAPDAGEGWGGLAIGHAVSRSVRDSALLLDLTAGAEPGDPYVAPAPERPFVDEVGRDPGKLRIAVLEQDHRGQPFHPENKAAIEAAARLCESLGHHVEPADPKIDLVYVRDQTRVLARAAVARTLTMRWQALGREPNPQDVERVTWDFYKRGLAYSAVEYGGAVAAVHAAGRQWAAFMADYDVVLSTTVNAPVPPLGYLDLNGDPDEFEHRANSYVSVTPLHNATGTPAMSVPLAWSRDGLPIGLHFAGRYGEEGLLLRLAAQLEQAQPWFDKVPAL